MPIVSVLIPNYNHASYLKERIESILQQTFQDFEIIILDDCSLDSSRELIENYRSNIHVTHIVYNETNSGSTFKQWQKGISLANGKYIWIAESDDWCEPTLLQVLIDGVKENDDIVIAYCGAVVVRDLDILYTSTSKKISEIIDGVSFIKEEMTERNKIFNASMAIFQKKASENISQEFTTYKYCGDWLFWIMLAQKGRVFESGKMLNYFRKHNADVSHKSMADGTYFLEHPRLTKYLVDNNLISHKRQCYLLFEKYKWLKKFNGSGKLKKELILNYQKLIGNKNRVKFYVQDWVHKVYIDIWIVTPRFIKNAIRKIVLRRIHS